MTSEKISEESKLTYDDRRKELTQNKSQVTENKTDKVMEGEKVIAEGKMISTVNQSMNVVYTEGGIRLAYKNLSNEKNFIEKRIADLKKQQDELGEMPKELKTLKSQLEKLQKYQAADKAKNEYEAMQERLKYVKKEIEEIKGTVGTRLKL